MRDEHWNSYFACLNFDLFNRPKKNSIFDFRGNETSVVRWTFSQMVALRQGPSERLSMQDFTGYLVIFSSNESQSPLLSIPARKAGTKAWCSSLHSSCTIKNMDGLASIWGLVPIWRRIVSTLFLDWTKLTMGTEIKGLKSGQRAKTNVKLQNTLRETTPPWQCLPARLWWPNQVWRCSVSRFFFSSVETPSCPSKSI